MAKPIKVTVLGDVDDLTGELGKGEKALAQFGAKFEGLGANIAAGAGKLGAAALAASGLGAAFVDALDAQAITAKLGAALGATADEAKRYGDVAGSLFSKGYGENLAQVADATKFVVQNISGMADASASTLERISAKALNVAQIFDQDLAMTTNAVANLMRNGLATSADHAFDIITKGLQNGANKSDDLLETFNEYATQFRDLGLSGEQALGLISQGLQAGARDADTVGDALKEFAIRAKDGSDTSIAAFDAIGLNADEMAQTFAKGGPAAADALDEVLDRMRAIPDPVKRSEVAIGLFGTKAEDMQQALFALDPSSAVSALGQVAGSADKAGKAFADNAASNLNTFLRQLQHGFTTIVGGYVLPVVNTLVTLLTAVLGPAFHAIGAVLSNTVVPALQATGQWINENSTLVSIIAGVITAVFLPALVKWGVTSTVNGAKAVGAFVAARAAAIGSAAAQWGALLQTVGGWVAAGTAAVVNAARVVGAWLAARVAAISGAAVMVAQMAITVASVVGGWVLMGTQALIRAAQMAAAWVIAMGPVGWVIAAIVGLVALIIANWDSVVSVTKSIFGAVWGFLQSVWSAIVSAVSGAVQAVLGAIEWLGELPGKVGAWFRSVYEGAKGKLGELVSWLGGLPGRVLGAIGDFGSLLLNAGKDLLTGLWNGIKNAAGWLKDKIFEFFGSLIPDWVKDMLGINSPSTVFRDLGRWLPPGLALGIDDEAKVAVDAAAAMASNVADAVRGADLGDLLGASVATAAGLPTHAAAARRAAGTAATTAAAASSSTVHNEINVNVSTDADPTEIGASVAWALRTSGR